VKINVERCFGRIQIPDLMKASPYLAKVVDYSFLLVRRDGESFGCRKVVVCEKEGKIGLDMDLTAHMMPRLHDVSANRGQTRPQDGTAV